MNTDDTEKLSFKFVLTTDTYDNHRFTVCAGINDEILTDRVVIEPNNDTEIMFEKELDLDQTYKIKLHFEGKESNCTIVGDNGEIVKDMIVTVKGIEIDELGFSHDMLRLNQFTRKDNAQIISGDDTFGFNGVFEISITTPYYLWVLENM